MKRTFQYFALFILILKFSLSNAQGGFRSRIYLPGSVTHVSKAIFEKSDGTYIAAGISLDTVNGVYFNRLVLMGLDAKGNLNWFKKYGSKHSEILENPLTTRSFFRAGDFLYLTSSIVENSTYQTTLFKFDLNGDSIWQRKYSMQGIDLIGQMGSTSVDGGFLLTGFAQNTVNSTSPCFVLKTDSDGQELWRKLLNKTTPNVSDGKSICQDSTSKKIVIVGYQYNVPVNSIDNILILDSLGNQLTQHSYENESISVLYDLVQAKKNEFIAIGSGGVSNGFGKPKLSNATVSRFHLDSVVKPMWRVMIDKPTSSNHNQCVDQHSNGDLLIGGLIDSSSNVLVAHSRFSRLNASGNILWRKYYYYGALDSTTSAFTIASLKTLKSGGWIASFKMRLTVPNNPFFFVKYDSTGCDTTEYYCKTVGLNEHVLAGTLIYPSPVNDRLNIELPIVSNVDVIITNIIGQEVKTERIIGQIDYQINMADLPGGIYVVSLRQGKNNVFQKKVVKIN